MVRSKTYDVETQHANLKASDKRLWAHYVDARKSGNLCVKSDRLESKVAASANRYAAVAARDGR